MKLVVARALLRLLAWCPLRVQRWLAGAVAAGICRFQTKRFKRTRTQIQRAMPALDSAALDALVRASLTAQTRTLLEAGALWYRPRDWIERHVCEIEGQEHIDAALSRGQGVILLGGHLGQWELAMLYCGLTLPVAFLYKPPRSATLDRELTRCRSRFGAEMISSTGPALRRAVRQLRSQRVLGLLFDQRPRAGHAVEADWFGRPVATMTLPHRLIQATGCAVVMVHCLRVTDPAGWKMVFDAVPGAEDADPVRATAAMNRALQGVIERAPEQYLWSYPRLPESGHSDAGG